LLTPAGSCNLRTSLPQPRDRNACRLARPRFRLIPVRSPLLRKSMSLSSPAGTEMFQFPAFAAFPYGFREGSRGIASRRFRIRASPDQSLPATPRSLSQLCYALHRLLTPKHPPCTLRSLTTLFDSGRGGNSSFRAVAGPRFVQQLWCSLYLLV
jgi:hypothetical protein